MKRGKTIVLIMGALLWAAAALGEEPAHDVSGEAVVAAPVLVSMETTTWSGEAEAGVVLTNGNTKTQSINTKLTIKRSGPQWENRLNAGYLTVSDANRTTAERTTASLESHYLLSAKDYIFGMARYEADRFSGYALQLSEAAGYGRRFPFSSKTLLEAEAGAGGRQARLTDGTKKRAAILRLAAKFRHTLGQASEFKEEVFSEFAQDNTHTESVTSLTSHINGNLSMKAAFTMTHNSRVPEGIKKTDTLTSVTLVFKL